MISILNAIATGGALLVCIIMLVVFYVSGHEK
jgi:hypothetical protein